MVGEIAQENDIERGIVRVRRWMPLAIDRLIAYSLALARAKRNHRERAGMAMAFDDMILVFRAWTER